MEGMMAVDTHVFNGRQKIAKQTYRYKHCCSVDFWDFYFILYKLEVKKYTLFNKFLSQKK